MNVMSAVVQEENGKIFLLVNAQGGQFRLELKPTYMTGADGKVYPALKVKVDRSLIMYIPNDYESEVIYY